MLWIRTSIQESKDTNASNFPLYVAKYDYDAGTDDDLSLRKGDYIFVISTEEGDWWYARNKETEKEGYVPSNYIAECQSLEAEEWDIIYYNANETVLLWQ